MVLKNYCVECGQRLHIGELRCPKCNTPTGAKKIDNLSIFIPPIHNIGFFNFNIDFSPFIQINRDNFEFMICSCGFLNKTSHRHCFNCGSNLKDNKLRDLNFNNISHKNETVLCSCGTVNNKEDIFCSGCGKSLVNDTFLSKGFVRCRCGAINSSENSYCEICGMRLSDDEKVLEEDLQSNFNIKFENSKFCFCGEENHEDDVYCRNCGSPLLTIENLSGNLEILCVCSSLNDSNNKYCMYCGRQLDKENKAQICICGTKNSLNVKVCQECGRPLNPHRIIKSRIVCTCGTILDFDSEFCPNCGKKIDFKKNNHKFQFHLKDIFK